MVIPSVESMLREVFGIEHEDYHRGFADGYAKAKDEMLAHVKSMQLLAFTTATVSTDEKIK